jgi:signal transduction histidine kinase
MKKVVGLRKRWLTNTLSIICALGLVCALAVTAAFALYYYSNLESDLRFRAGNTSSLFSNYLNRSPSEYYDTCMAYTQEFESAEGIQLQIIDIQGYIAASSAANWVNLPPQTPEIPKAMNNRATEVYLGEDPITGLRVMAVASPLIFEDEVVGALRYVRHTEDVDTSILMVGLICLSVLMIVMAVVYITTNVFIRSVMGQVGEITEKARLIANGTYGARIQTRYADEIGELADTVNELSGKISQNEKMQAEFISQLSHELRTPLTVITGWTETLLADESMDDDTHLGMTIISREAKRLTEMVVDLLDFTRMQDGRMTLNVEQADIRSEFEDTVYMYSARLAQDGIDLQYLDTDADIPEISCDPKRLRQVFLNILDNAAKHGGAGKRIESSISYENDHVLIRIRDFGPGIPEDEIPLVKKKFYKGSSSVRGTGIGLAVCDEIVQMHNGTLTLENAQGGGTLVTVCLPAVQ